MRGSAEEGRSAFVYERALARLCGLEHGVRPPFVADVSATNGLCFFALLLRLGRQGDEVLDVLSFERDTSRYVGFERCAFFRQRLLAGLKPGDCYVNADVLAIFRDTLATDRACLLDCTARGVNTFAVANQQFHAAALVDGLQAEDVAAGGARLLDTRTFAFIFVHGTDTTFRGKVGLRFGGAEAAARLAELQEESDELYFNPEEGVRLGQPLKHLDAAQCSHMPATMRAFLTSPEWVAQESLRALLQRIEDDIARLNPRYSRLMRTSLSTEQLTLTLLLLRRRWPDMPVVVVGHGMVRRSLSIVAVDTMPAPGGVDGFVTKTLLAVTHEVQWAAPGANAADVAQQFLRFSTTQQDFHGELGPDGMPRFPNIQILAPEHGAPPRRIRLARSLSSQSGLPCAAPLHSTPGSPPGLTMPAHRWTGRRLWLASSA